MSAELPPMLDEDFETLWLGPIERQPGDTVFPAIRTATTAKLSK